jgi:micrococcal nuclease
MGWFPYPKSEESSESSESWTFSSQVPSAVKDYVEINLEFRERFQEVSELSDSQKLFVGVLAVTSFALGFKAGRFQNPWRRFGAVTDIPKQYFGDTAPFLRGRVLSVSDGDTIRFRHTPSLFFQSSALNKGEKLSEVALPIRICTIDTPETAKFGKEGQPFGEDAKEYLSSMVNNKIVYCQLLHADQYGRAVAQVRFGALPFWQSFADEKMLKAGLAEVYLGSGAVYGRKGKEAYMDMMEKAKSSKTGMWSQGDKRESAAAYKARTKAVK